MAFYPHPTKALVLNILQSQSALEGQVGQDRQGLAALPGQQINTMEGGEQVHLLDQKNLLGARPNNKDGG